MSFLPLEKMWQRVKIDMDKSDEAYFNALMYTGEMIIKLGAAGIIAGIGNQVDRQQYRLEYQLVRADGLGVWAEAIGSILSGVPLQRALPELQSSEIKQLTEEAKPGDWRYECCKLLDECLAKVNQKKFQPSKRYFLRDWFRIFAQLRNSTRGHGAIGGNLINLLNGDLDGSLRLISDNWVIFQRGWVYIQRNYSGRYKLIKWNKEAESFNRLKTREGEIFNLEEGIYINFGQENSAPIIHNIRLVWSDVDVSDIYLPNGGWKDKEFETLSYITGSKFPQNSKQFSTPIGVLPPSETQGLNTMVEKGLSFSNLPPSPKGYVQRAKPEERLRQELTGDNEHRIITLLGRGGIGKTWLALKVLEEIAKTGTFDAVLWFSARDIDLQSDGARQVAPHILTENDVAEEFANLIAPYMMSHDQINSKSFNKLDFLKSNIRSSSLGKILFVFDNFETVSNPIDLYNWIDTNLRLPNKALITTRFREFKGDYPIELHGMSETECEELVIATARNLHLEGMITSDYIRDIFTESGGHPYVVRILLSEVKKNNKPIKLERVLASQEDLLDTLFERTFSRLSLPAQRVFLTLCDWRSVVAQIAIESILLRPENERIDVHKAIDDLQNSSLIEVLTSEADNEIFLSLPLVALKFGKRKLKVSRMKAAIEADVELLKFFGASQQSDIRRGISPRIYSLISNIEKRVSLDNSAIQNYAPILEFIGRKHPPALIRLADLYNALQDMDQVESVLKRYLEISEDIEGKRLVWQRLVAFYAVHNRYADELFGLIESIQLVNTDYDSVSAVANRFNNFIGDSSINLPDYEKQYGLNTLIPLMEERLHEATATDCSRLAWLYIHKRDYKKAKETSYRGLEIDPDNTHCIKLVWQLNGGI